MTRGTQPKNAMPQIVACVKRMRIEANAMNQGFIAKMWRAKVFKSS